MGCSAKFGHSGGRRVQVGDAAGLGHLAGHVVAHDLRQAARHGQQAVQVHAGVVPHGLQHVDGVFAADVAAGARRVGAAAQPAQRAVEAVDAPLHGGQHIGQPHAAGVVEVQRQLQAGETLLQGVHMRATWAGWAMPVVSHMVRPRTPRSAKRSAQRSTSAAGTSPSIGQPKQWTATR
jgi:hypothetical protein